MAVKVNMDNLPPEVLTQILEKTDWSDLLECRKVSKHVKESADLVIQRKAKSRIEREAWGGYWRERAEKYPGFSTWILALTDRSDGF